MSEYQYYEFRAIDRPLTSKEMSELRALSTRAEITPTSFTNSYQWGDFKGKPAALMDRYFDAFLYFANWGSRQLMLRIPRRFLDDEAAAYTDGETFLIRFAGEHAVIEFSSEDEDGEDFEDDLEEEDDRLTALLEIRNKLMRGDLRAFYLGWLASLRSGGWHDEGGSEGADPDGDDQFEPPVPPGLAQLSAALRALAAFLRIDDELIQVAAAGNTGEPPAGPSHADMTRWIQELPTTEKDAYLVRFLAEEGDLALRAELVRRFRVATATKGPRSAPDSKRRTIRQLLAARAALLQAKERKAAERAAAEKKCRDQEQAQSRGQYLDELARREAAAWREAEALIATKLPKNYDRAVTLLVDLRALAARTNRLPEAEVKIQQLRQEHPTKHGLLKRFDEKKLGR